jgi:hypothetical protein
LKYGNDPEETLIRTVSLGFLYFSLFLFFLLSVLGKLKGANAGGDADTVGAIVGALLGALYGTRWIPKRWLDNIEDNVWGKTWMIETGPKLAALDFKMTLSRQNAPKTE